MIFQPRRSRFFDEHVLERIAIIRQPSLESEGHQIICDLFFMMGFPRNGRNFLEKSKKLWITEGNLFP